MKVFLSTTWEEDDEPFSLCVYVHISLVFTVDWFPSLRLLWPHIFQFVVSHLLSTQWGESLEKCTLCQVIAKRFVDTNQTQHHRPPLSFSFCKKNFVKSLSAVYFQLVLALDFQSSDCFNETVDWFALLISCFVLIAVGRGGRFEWQLGSWRFERRRRSGRRRWQRSAEATGKRKSVFVVTCIARRCFCLWQDQFKVSHKWEYQLMFFKHVYVCVCVWYWRKERKGGKQKLTSFLFFFFPPTLSVWFRSRKVLGRLSRGTAGAGAASRRPIIEVVKFWGYPLFGRQMK